MLIKMKDVLCVLAYEVFLNELQLVIEGNFLYIYFFTFNLFLLCAYYVFDFFCRRYIAYTDKKYYLVKNSLLTRVDKAGFHGPAP